MSGKVGQHVIQAKGSYMKPYNNMPGHNGSSDHLRDEAVPSLMRAFPTCSARAVRKIHNLKSGQYLQFMSSSSVMFVWSVRQSNIQQKGEWRF